MLDVLIWWLLLELIGIAVLPFAFRFFRHLPDRGYAFIKPLGLLLIAYPFWLLTTFGFLTNTRGNIAFVALGVTALSWWLGKRPRTKDEGRMTEDESPNHPITQSPNRPIENPITLRAWLRQNATLILTTELVFTLAFLAWVLIRAYMPEITATEKPMEFAFLNGVLQSERFPPIDPWLAGYGISYYYFGYLIVGMLTLLSGIPSSITFNLAIATLFALGATGAYGLAYNLIRLSPLAPRAGQSLFFAIFAPIFLVVIGNLEGFLEALHARGIGSPAFWQWLDVKGLADAPVTNSWVPNDMWWWWRASRVIHDVVAGNTLEVIDEFPQFSFLLGDLHPHVLALPFALLALAAALNLPHNSQFTTRNSQFARHLRFEIWNLEFLIYPLILGGLFFLNSWDILPYGFIFLAAFAIARYRTKETWDTNATRDLIVFATMLGVLSIVMYLPFFIGFQSQAGGLLPVLFVKTRLHQYLLMFGIFVFIIGAFVLTLAREHKLGLPEWFAHALPYLTAAILFPLIIAILALIVLALSPALQEQALAILPGARGNLLGIVAGGFFGPWFTDPWLFVMLALFLATLLVLVRLRLDEPSTTFVLLLALTGFLLTFGVEFVYLRDQFGTRMNTVFKFYFQAWTLFSIAAAYAVFYLARTLNGIVRGMWFVGFALLLGASLIYPTLAIPNRAEGFAKDPTLDGIAWIRNLNPGDHAAIEWLNANAPRGATILEAVGGEYSYGNRISMATGLPTVLGWVGHELQWRGNSKLFQNPEAGIDRAADVQRIYQTLDAQELLTYLNKYDIKFVIVGQTEKSQYGLGKSQIDKFGKVMRLVFEASDTTIFAR
jgi:YYY domain-containing protein